MKKHTILFTIISTLFFSISAEAQCAMCKATAEQSDVIGLNLGIFVLFAMPYLLVGTIGYLWWRNKKKEEDTPRNSIANIQSEQLN